MTYDICIVKFTPNEQYQEAFEKTLDMLADEEWDGCGVQIYDNTLDGRSLTGARNALSSGSCADVLVFMDFDFARIDVDFRKICTMANRPQVGIVIPGIGSGEEWEEFSRCPCNMMAIRRKLLKDLGGWCEDFEVAFADWDLLNRVQELGLGLLRHNPSTVEHVGLSGTLPSKHGIWGRDAQTYREKWGAKSWR